MQTKTMCLRNDRLPSVDLSGRSSTRNEKKSQIIQIKHLVKIMSKNKKNDNGGELHTLRIRVQDEHKGSDKKQRNR